MNSNGRHVVTITILAHTLLRIASSASGVLIGIYLANLSGHGLSVDASLLGTLGAVSFAAELITSIPMGMASDAVSPRWLMVSGALVGALAVQLFALSSHVEVFFLSRALEGIGVAAVTPPLLAYLADATTHDSALRARVMSFFELSLLAGLALGGLMGSQFWKVFDAHAFSLVALAYLASAALRFFGAKGRRSRGSHAAWQCLLRALNDPSVRSLAPVWLCVNAVVGLWLGPTLPFLLTKKPNSSQYLDGLFADSPVQVGWLLLGYAVVFGTGVFAWSFALPRMRIRSALRLSLSVMPFVHPAPATSTRSASRRMGCRSVRGARQPENAVRRRRSSTATGTRSSAACAGAPCQGSPDPGSSRMNHGRCARCDAPSILWR